MDAINLMAGLGLLGLKAFALFLMVLGAIDLWTHYQEKEGEN